MQKKLADDTVMKRKMISNNRKGCAENESVVTIYYRAAGIHDQKNV